MAELPVVAGLQDLESHLQELLKSPETPLNAKLFDDVELQLNDTNTPPLIPRLLPNLTQILSTYQSDPAILASLAIKLLKPLQFVQILTLASEDALIQALLSLAPSANLLGITVVEKAARSPSDTAILSIMKNLIEAFVRIWLSTPDVEVGEKATRVLGDLLDVDCDRRSIVKRMDGLEITTRRPAGQGLLWRRIFQDGDIYGLIFDLCSSTTIGKGAGQLDERQKSLAQARLLRIIPRLAALDFHTLSHSHFPNIDRKYGLESEQGLLWFAAVEMVNKEEDVLMHITVIDFFAEFLEVISSTTDVSPATFEYLAKLMKEVTKTDQTMYKSLESIAVNPESAPELVDLLIRLNQHE